MSETYSPLKQTVGFIGGGNMAYAIASGLLNKGVLKAEQICVSATNLANLQKRWCPLGVTHVTTNNGEIVSKADTVFICVKPQIFPQIVGDIESAVLKLPSSAGRKLYVSIMAGVTLERLASTLPMIDANDLVRAMPNTPMQVGVGCTVFCRLCTTTDTLYEALKFMFGALGLAYEVRESQINAATGLAGCGPAYVYEFIEALADGGVKQGIPRDMALRLAAQTVMGAAKTVLDTGKHPAVLKDEVCSPGGATIHGVHALEQGSMRGTVMNAVERATNRADQLS
ncbi:pyrroline-5-carboxylate reductase [Anopheles stephensi]|uniref:Pyrroline-5-carboxylate reductase n=1 Tax=Anopheles stephensi TaxID=30069 RepID=A0A182XVF1_ANOST|nr:pyrroline-5-carboxylate reductase [Anopheles stephensi]